MKLFFLTRKFIFFYSIAFLALATPALAAPSAKAKKVNAACTAIIAATTGVAVYTTNVVHPNPSMPIFSLRSHLYRDRKVMHLFLSRGLGKKFTEYFDFQLDLVDPEDTHISAPWGITRSFEDLAKNQDYSVFGEALKFAEGSTPQHAWGILFLPGFLARFDFKLVGENLIEYRLYDIAENSLLQRGTFTFSALPPRLR